VSRIANLGSNEASSGSFPIAKLISSNTRYLKAAKFPTVKSLDSFDFAAFPSLNKALVGAGALGVCRAAREHYRTASLFLYGDEDIKSLSFGYESGSKATPRPHAVIVADRDGVIREWNAVAERIFGYAALEAIGKTIDLVMPEDERADHWRNYQRVMKTNVMNYTPDHILDIEGVRQDGSRVSLDAMLKPIRDASGRITAITAIMRECVIDNAIPAG
jgi:PAS domain S-box-containing protein